MNCEICHETLLGKMIASATIIRVSITSTESKNYMRVIGLLGGMSWESSMEYYRLINQTVKERLGGFHSAKSVMVSVDFAEIEALQSAERWADATRLMIAAAKQVERAGANFLVICTNTMHKMAEEVQATLNIPILHIADATADAIKKTNIQTVGLLGTRFTMEQDFYRQRLIDKHGLAVLIPDEAGRDCVHRVIYEELVKGIISEESRQEYQKVVGELVKRGAEAIILGCTEIGLLLKAEHSPVPLFDTTVIHATAAVEYSL